MCGAPAVLTALPREAAPVTLGHLAATPLRPAQQPAGEPLAAPGPCGHGGMTFGRLAGTSVGMTSRVMPEAGSAPLSADRSFESAGRHLLTDGGPFPRPAGRGIRRPRCPKTP